jgi:hypothetical protein
MDVAMATLKCPARREYDENKHFSSIDEIASAESLLRSVPDLKPPESSLILSQKGVYHLHRVSNQE